MSADLVAFNEKDRLESLHQLHILDTPIQESFERITRITQKLFNIPIVAISFIDETRQWFKSIKGLNLCETAREISFCSHAILQDNIFEIRDALKDRRFKNNPLVVGPPKIRYYAGYPIRIDTHKLGTICIIDINPRKIAQDDLALLKDLAALVEAELQNYKISKAQKKLVIELDHANRAKLIDPLTRLWNREGIMQILKNQIAYSQKNNLELGLAIADIDHFKLVNDNYGHIVGDKALKEIAEELIKNSREQDAIGRIGGEEFMIIINESNPEAIFSIAERLRLAVEKRKIRYGHKVIKLTITIGVGKYDPTTRVDLLQLIDGIDKNLYAGKISGRNQVVQLSFSK